MSNEYDFFDAEEFEEFEEVEEIQPEIKKIEKIKENKENNKMKSSNQKRLSSGRNLQGLECHIFNEANAMKFFFTKKGNRTKKNEFYSFFFNSENLNLNNDIERLINKWHKSRILLKNSQGWYYPNTRNKNEIIIKILEKK